MNAAPILLTMLERAAPVVQSYWTDIRHDARLIATADPHSAFLWAPVKTGTRVILLQRGEKPNMQAAELFETFSKQGDVAQWYYICVATGDCVANDYARALAEGATQRAVLAASALGDGEYVSEIHM